MKLTSLSYNLIEVGNLKGSCILINIFMGGHRLRDLDLFHVDHRSSKESLGKK